jgi:predicted chitinase
MATSKELVEIMRNELASRGYSLDTQAAILGQFKKEMQFAPKYATQPEARSETSANIDYANKNGNTEKGDGYKYRGRSYIQLTGKGNYKKVGEELFLAGVIDDPDALVTNPDLLLDPVLGAKASIAYLTIQPGFKKVIEQPDVNQKSIALTKLINPGLFSNPELRHKDNKGNRTGITYQEDINLRTKYADNFRKQLILNNEGIPVGIDGIVKPKGETDNAWDSKIEREGYDAYAAQTAAPPVESEPQGTNITEPIGLPDLTNKEDIKRVQQTIGVKADGIWGPISQQAWKDTNDLFVTPTYREEGMPTTEPVNINTEPTGLENPFLSVKNWWNSL